jgi:hypothetical protein
VPKGVIALTLAWPGDSATGEDANVRTDDGGVEAVGVGSSDDVAALAIGEEGEGVGCSVAVATDALAEGADCSDPHPATTMASTAAATTGLLFMAGS